MATKSIASTVNPIIDIDNPQQTLSNAKGVIWFLTLTASELASAGCNDDANNGLCLVLECAAQAVDHAEHAVHAMQVAGVKHGE